MEHPTSSKTSFSRIINKRRCGKLCEVRGALRSSRIHGDILHSFDFETAKYGFDLKSTFSRPDQSTIVYHEDVDKKWIEMDGMKFTIDGSIKGSNTLQVWNTTWTYCQSVDRQMGQLVRSVIQRSVESAIPPTYLSGCYRSAIPPPSYLTSGCRRSAIHSTYIFRLLPNDPTPPPHFRLLPSPIHLHLPHFRLLPSLRSTSTYLSSLCDCRCSDIALLSTTTAAMVAATAQQRRRRRQEMTVISSSSSDDEDDRMRMIETKALRVRVY
jgi:hypothetical protein